jgi:hypothetical protein
MWRRGYASASRRKPGSNRKSHHLCSLDSSFLRACRASNQLPPAVQHATELGGGLGRWPSVIGM